MYGLGGELCRYCARIGCLMQGGEREQAPGVSRKESASGSIPASFQRLPILVPCRGPRRLIWPRVR